MGVGEGLQSFIKVPFNNIKFTVLLADVQMLEDACIKDFIFINNHTNIELGVSEGGNF